MSRKHCFSFRSGLLIVRLVLPASVLLSSTPLTAFEGQIQQLANELAPKLAEAGKQRVAVVDFTDLQGNASELGRFLAEELSLALVETKGAVQIVDRTHLGAILAEHKLSTTGLVDPATARKVGQIAGVDALITGTIIPFSESIRITVKVLDMETAQILASSRQSIPITKTIQDLSEGDLSTVSASLPTGNAGPGEAERRRQRAPNTPVAPVDLGEVRLALERCVFESSRVKCDFLVENRGAEEKRIYVSASNSYLNTITGAQFAATRVSLGVHSGGQVRQTVVPGVPLRGHVGIEGVRSSLDRAHVILRVSLGRYTNVVFRDVPIEASKGQ